MQLIQASCSIKSYVKKENIETNETISLDSKYLHHVS